MKLFLSILLLCASLIAGAQEEREAARPQRETYIPERGLHTSVGAALAMGQSAPRPVLQGGVGYQFGALYAGLGSGYDWYRWKTVPVYAEGRYYPIKGSGLYGYGQAGYSIIRRDKKSLGWGTAATWREGGMFSEIGFGYRFRTAKAQSFSFASGYSVKKLSGVERYSCTTCEDSPDDRLISKYRLSRAVIKMIYEFNW